MIDRNIANKAIATPIKGVVPQPGKEQKLHGLQPLYVTILVSHYLHNAMLLLPKVLLTALPFFIVDSQDKWMTC